MLSVIKQLFKKLKKKLNRKSSDIPIGFAMPFTDPDPEEVNRLLMKIGLKILKKAENDRELKKSEIWYTQSRIEHETGFLKR